MAAAAIHEIPGGSAQALRNLPGEENRRSGGARDEVAALQTAIGEGVDSRAARDDSLSSRAARDEGLDSRAILDENQLTENAKRLERLQRLGARPLETQMEIASLQARDAEVRMHEATHVAAGDGYVVGGATFSYQTGPDGRQYAIGGHVDIDTSPIPGKPEETLRKMRVVKAAALATGQPSAADFAVAAAAAEAEAAALAELAVARSREVAARYAGEMALGRDAGIAGASVAPAAPGAVSAALRDEGPPPTPFDVIA
jgi:hypothetical protein